MIMDSDTARNARLQAQPSGQQQSFIRFYTTNDIPMSKALWRKSICQAAYQCWDYQQWLDQTVKSRTTDGFVRNFPAGSHKSHDFIEPLLRSQILVRIYKEHGDEWLVRLDKASA